MPESSPHYCSNDGRRRQGRCRLVSPKLVRLSDWAKFILVAPRKQRLTLVRPYASVHEIRWLTSGCISRATPKTNSGSTSGRSLASTGDRGESKLFAGIFPID